jgi:MFS family permease
MVSIVRYNSVGFFFTDFVIPYVSGVMLGGSGLQVGLMYAFLTLGSSISGFIVGYLTDRHSKKTLIAIGAVGRGVAYLMIYSAIVLQSLLVMNISTFFFGALVAVFWVPYDTLVSQKSNKDHRSYAFGRRTGAQGQGMLVGAAVGITIFIVMTLLGLPPAYIYSPMLIYCGSNVVGAVMFLRRIDENLRWSPPKKEGEQADPPAIAPVLKTKAPASEQVLKAEAPANGPVLDGSASARNGTNRGYLLGFVMLIIAFLLSNMNAYISRPFMQIYLNRDIEKNPIFVLLAIAPASITANLIGPRLGNAVDKVNHYAGITIFSILAAIITWGVISVTSIWQFAALEVADLSLATTISLLLANIFSRVSVSHRGKILGFSASFQDLGASVGPIIGGLALDAYGVKMPFIISIFLVLMLIPVYLVAIRKLKPYLVEKF